MSATTTDQQASRASVIEQIAVNVLLGVLFGLFAYSGWLSWARDGHIQMLILALQETIIVALVVTRRRTRDESRAWNDRLIAIAGTALPLLLRAGGEAPPMLQAIGSSIQLVGTTLSLIAVLSLGRSFGIVAANRGVRTGGFYRFVRHPLYGSYIIGNLGFILGNPTLWNIALVIAALSCHYIRALAEERVLARDPAYQDYMSRVRYRFIPFIF